MPKCISFLILISNVPYFECADFKSDIGFQKFEPKSEHFVFKKYQLSKLNEILPVPYFELLISNLTFVYENFERKSPNLNILTKKYY